MTTDTFIEEKKVTTRKFKEPSKYKVVVLNDDFTPMEFVVALLIKVFRIDHDGAVSLTMKIHNDGSAVAGVYSFEIAEQKVIEATELARLNGHPLIIKAVQE
jgi:ATP-dependent Clp protease adaptor protein ClpS